MGIGLGIVLLLIGLVLVMGVLHLPASVTNTVDAHTLGWILVVVGVLAIVLALVLNMQRGRARTTVVEERRLDDTI